MRRSDMSESVHKCRACGKPIVFRQTKAGKWMPRDKDGTLHWQTCTDPRRFRVSDKEVQARDDGQQNLF